MDNKKYIICGDAHLPQLVTKEEDTIRFHIDGTDDDFRIMLEIENIRDNVYKDVPSRFRDLLDIATYVFAADQAVVRGANDVETFGSSWRRRFHFVIPVADLDFWSSESVQLCLRETLSFLSDDYYEFDFVQTAGRPLLQGFFKNLNDNGELFGFPEQIIMFSGGIDSLGGAVEEIINQKRRVILVNHRSTEKMDKRYQTMRELIDKKAPDNLPSHIRVTVNKKNRSEIVSKRLVFIGLNAYAARKRCQNTNLAKQGRNLAVLNPNLALTSPSNCQNSRALLCLARLAMLEGSYAYPTTLVLLSVPAKARNSIRFLP